MNKFLETLRSLYAFGIAPRRCIGKKDESIATKIKLSLLLTIICVFSSNVLIIPSDLLLNDVTYNDDVILKRFGWPVLFILTTIAFPLLEEFLFRYPLKFVIGSALLYLSVFTITAITLILHFANKEYSAHFIFMILLMVIILLFFLIPRLKKEYHYRRIFIRYYSHNVWMSILVFAAIHIFNYQLHSDLSILLSPLLVLPQLAGGFMLSFVRLRFDIGYSILIHGLNNAILLIIIYSKT